MKGFMLVLVVVALALLPGEALASHGDTTGVKAKVGGALRAAASVVVRPVAKRRAARAFGAGPRVRGASLGGRLRAC